MPAQKLSQELLVPDPWEPVLSTQRRCPAFGADFVVPFAFVTVRAQAACWGLTFAYLPSQAKRAGCLESDDPRKTRRNPLWPAYWQLRLDACYTCYVPGKNRHARLEVWARNLCTSQVSPVVSTWHHNSSSCRFSSSCPTSYEQSDPSNQTSW